jgi:glycosyltransferase involved in cell wall biosynthesis
LKLLVLAYFFPPLGGAGVQRTLKFVRYLPEFGISPTVVTTHQSGYWIRDETLLKEIPKSIAVHRVKNPLPMGGAGKGKRRSTSWVRLLRWIAGLSLVPDAYRPWSYLAARQCARILGREPDTMLWTTSSPDSSHLAGLHLNRKFAIPWIADFRDPWTQRMSFAPPTMIHRKIHHSMERAVVERASKVVVTSHMTREDFIKRYPSVDPGKFVVLTNGFDEGDFREFETNLSPDLFRILHLGQLNPERSLIPLLEPLSRLLQRQPDARGRIEVLCVGPHYATHEAEAARYGLEGLVRFTPPCHHQEGVRRLGTANLLLLLEQEGDRGRLILPGKFWEYLRSGRPLLTLADPQGDAVRLTRELGSGWAFSPNSADEILECLEGRWQAFRDGRTETGAHLDDLAPFERKALTHQLSDLLKNL